MNKDTAKGQWQQLKGKVKEQWGKFTDDEIQQMDGSRDQLIGKVQEKYGRTREEAEKEVNNFWNER